MSQSDFGDLESPLTGEAFINTYLEPWRDAVHSMHSGSSRPSYAVAGTMWLDTTTSPWIVKVFNGTANDVTIGTIDPTNLWFKPAGTTVYAGTAGGTANAITLSPNIPLTAYAAGTVYEFLVSAANTVESPTINISALGNKNTKCSVGAGKVNLPIGAFQSGMIARVIYDGTDLILLNIRANNKSADIATASTVNLNNASGDYVKLTGTTTVTAFTLAEGLEKTILCEGAFTLTDSTASSPQQIICPTGANITTAAGDVFRVRGEAGGVVRVVGYMRADGTAIAGASGAGAYAETTAAHTVSSANTIAIDDSNPQITEGSEILTLAYSASSATATLIIEVEAWCMTASNNPEIVAALFVDSTANSIGASSHHPQNTIRGTGINFSREYQPGDTSSHTYRLRIGPAVNTSNVYVNSNDGSNNAFGGQVRTSIRITEVER